MDKHVAEAKAGDDAQNLQVVWNALAWAMEATGAEECAWDDTKTALAFIAEALGVEEKTDDDAPAPEYTKAEADAALSLWDELEVNAAGKWPQWEAFRENYGIADARDTCLSLARAAEKVWVAAGDDFEGSFDFEFAPLFLKYCTNAESDNDPSRVVGCVLPLMDKEAVAKAAKALCAIYEGDIRRITGEKDLRDVIARL